MFYKFKSALIQYSEQIKYYYLAIILVISLVLLYKVIKIFINENNIQKSLKNKIINTLKNKYFIMLIMVILPIAFEVIIYNNYKIDLTKDAYIRIFLTYFACISIFIYKIIQNRTKTLNKIIDIIVKYRYRIAIIVFILLLILKINFSSIGMWNEYIKEGVDTTIFGKSRAIRSDEWLVTTPFNLAQSYNGFKLVNDNIAVGNNDMNIFHGPVLDWSTPVKIFSWGYIFFGNELGISWAWLLKFIIMFMIYFEFGMIITKKDKGLSLLLAVWITFSPAIMWWSMLEIPAFAIAIIVLFHTYISNKNLSIKGKILIAYGMVVFICNFAYALYPAWQVPLAYLILVFIAVDFLRYRKNLQKKDYLIMSLTLLISILLLAYFVVSSWNGIQSMMNTKYPGAREIIGGGYDFRRLTNYYTNFFTPYSDDYQNPCEIASFIYPGTTVIIILLCGILKKIKKKNIKETLKDKQNWYIYGLLFILIIFLLWMAFPWPRVLGKITLLYNSPTERLETIFEFTCLILTVFLAVKVFENKEKMLNNKLSLIISIVISIISCLLAKNGIYSESFTKLKLIILFSFIFLMNYSLLSSNKKMFIYVMLIISLFTGIYINPINIGIKSITGTEIANKIEEIRKTNPNEIWIGESQINAQYLVANGVKVLNGINEYPNYDWINKLDSDYTYEEVWNRYAHIIVSLGNEVKFELLTPDLYILTLNHEKIKELSIKYFYTSRNIENEEIEQFNLKKIYQNENTGQYIYKFE